MMIRWNSLSWQIQLYYLLVLIGLATAVDILMIRSYEANRRRELEVELASSLAECKNVMFPRLAPKYAILSDDMKEGFGRGNHSGPVFDLRRSPKMGGGRSGRPLPSFIKRETGILDGLVAKEWFAMAYSPFGNMHFKAGEIVEEFELEDFDKKSGLDFRQCGDYLVVCQRFDRKSVFAMGMPLGDEPKLLAAYKKKVVLVSLAAVCGVFLSAAAFVHWVLRPLKRVRQVAGDVAKGHFDERVEVRPFASYEFKELGVSLNKSFEDLERLFEKQKAFASEVAHELRTPVAGLLHQSNYAIESDNLEDKNEALEFCHHAGKRMHNITDSLLELASLELEAMNCRFEPCMLHITVMDAVSVLCNEAENKGLSIDTDQLDEVEVHGNPDLLWQLVVNLVKNAIKYTDAGKVTVRTRRDGENAILEVIDTGAGISVSDQEKLFDRFYRGESGNNAKDDGVGIGLTICQSIVKIHDGQIAVHSESGEGTTIEVIIANV